MKAIKRFFPSRLKFFFMPCTVFKQKVDFIPKKRTNDSRNIVHVFIIKNLTCNGKIYVVGLIQLKICRIKSGIFSKLQESIELHKVTLYWVASKKFKIKSFLLSCFLFNFGKFRIYIAYVCIYFQNKLYRVFIALISFSSKSHNIQ